MKTKAFCLAAATAALALAAAAPGRAATSAPGPYYATPSWDQKLPPETRFVLLSNWNNEAVLDRETGLVWKTTVDSWGSDLAEASMRCLNTMAGGRAGWRLPTAPEVMRTLFFVGWPNAVESTPFDRPLTGQTIWTTTSSVNREPLVVVLAVPGSSVAMEAKGLRVPVVTWCVQSSAAGSAAP